ncbi:hypothetical protein NKI19_19385 [Mesorhizobium sp. M0751]|uniref:hypothetical protein n=1 Tax=unclassified Mesorhizobium TaxID=325217 RepID=UPI00333DF2D3
MTTENTALLNEIREAMDRLGVGQVQLALSCGYTQSYISKVLNLRAKMTDKLERKLTFWLSSHSMKEAVSSAEIEAIVQRLARAKPERRMHIMNILRGLAGMS